LEEAEKVFVGGVQEKVLHEVPIVDDDCDDHFAEEILRIGGVDVHVCYQCGNCTGVCPVSMKEENKIRNLIKMCQMGLKKKVLATPWFCATCHRCYEHCPAGMNPAEIVIALRHMIVRELGPPPFVVAVSQNVADTAQSVPLSEGMRRTREKLGLPGDPFDRIRRDRVVKEVKTIMKLTNYDKLIGIDLGEFEISGGAGD